ncbi:succinate--CoA ligase subunit beta [bacterium CG2_30_54_10]|nr:MAG: succinate--CoA ligase subunit beta [bacterium CG2_30_54_10]
MKLLEFQGKDLFRKFGLPVPKGVTISNESQVDEALKQLPGSKVVLKAQVFVGGRGKAGGIKIASNPKEAKEKAHDIFSMKIKGFPVNRLLIEEPIDIDKELYLSFVLDRDNKCFKMIFSPCGGMDIEEIAAKEPEKLLFQKLEYFPGLQSFQLREMIPYLKGFPPGTFKEIAGMASNLYKLFIEKEASLVEINPLVVSKQGKCLACDSKVVFDDNALFRHKDIAEYKLPDEDDPYEREAREKNLNYVKLNGNIGCMVNGAGLAMATMDVIKYFGGDPANFLDIGGGAKAQEVTAAIGIILKDPNVKAVFINIFGGIVRCDLVAEGIIAAKKALHITKPVVIRLLGTNDKKAYEMLKAADMSAFSTMATAAKEVVAAAKKAGK